MSETSRSPNNILDELVLVVPHLRGIAYKMLGDDDNVMDYIQDALVWCVANKNKYDPMRGSVKTWAGVALRSTIVDAMRSRGSSANLVELTESGDLSGVELRSTTKRDSNDIATDEDVSKQKRLETLLHMNLVKLPATQREVLNLYYVEGKNDREISEALGIARSSVKDRRLRALAHLRKMLGGHK